MSSPNGVNSNRKYSTDPNIKKTITARESFWQMIANAGGESSINNWVLEACRMRLEAEK